jgi:hypothetical protein
MDPSVQNQLSIESRQHFKNVDAQGFSQFIHDSFQGTLTDINKKVEEIQSDASLKKSANPILATQYIEQLKNQGQKILNQYQDLSKLIEAGQVEQAKKVLYETNISSRLMTNYAWSKDEVKDSPLFNAQMKQAEYELRVSEFAYKQRHDADELKYKYDELSAKAKGNKGDGPGDGVETVTHDALTPDQAGVKTRSTFYSGLDQDKKSLTQTRLEWVFRSYDPNDKNNPIRKNPQTGQFEYNVDPTGTNSNFKSQKEASEADIKQYSNLRSLIDNGQLTNNRKDLSDFYRNNIQPAYRIVQQKTKFAEGTEAQFKPEIEKINKEIGNKEVVASYYSPTTKSYEKLKVSAADLVNVYTVKNNLSGSEDAQKALESNFGKEGARYLITNAGVRTTNDPYATAYNQATGIIKKNSQFAEILQRREQAFKGAQSSFIPSETEILPKSPAEEQNWQRRFITVAQNYKPSGANKGAADEFLDMVNSPAKDGVKSFSIVHDQNDRKWYLKVGAGKEAKMIPVDEKYINEWGFQTQNQFWNTYGNSLSIKNNTTTDIEGTKESSAYFMDRGNNPKYDVRYHLEGTGGNEFSVRMWIRDHATGKLLLGDHNIGVLGGPDAIMAALNSPEFYKSDLMIDGLLAKQK